jgi:hypothetical protein
LGFAHNSLFGAGKAVLRPIACDQVPGARGSLFAIGLPVLLARTWVGLRPYAQLDEAGFRKVVLILVWISGLGLVMRGS